MGSTPVPSYARGGQRDTQPIRARMSLPSCGLRLGGYRNHARDPVNQGMSSRRQRGKRREGGCERIKRAERRNRIGTRTTKANERLRNRTTEYSGVVVLDAMMTGPIVESLNLATFNIIVLCACRPSSSSTIHPPEPRHRNFLWCLPLRFCAWFFLARPSPTPSGLGPWGIEACPPSAMFNRVFFHSLYQHSSTLQHFGTLATLALTLPSVCPCRMNERFPYHCYRIGIGLELELNLLRTFVDWLD